MNVVLSIDDTDNHESIGSGRLLEILVEELSGEGLVARSANIVRHQLFFHVDVPYTSHNSAMSVSADIGENNLGHVIGYAQAFLEKFSAQGSDPGLCVYALNGAPEKHDILEFGNRAKRCLVSKEEAYALARKAGAHLTEHGGSGDGIIGALAAIGLRIGGNDGRFRGWLCPGREGDVVTAGDLCLLPDVDDVVDQDGMPVLKDTLVRVCDDRMKTVFRNNRQVVLLTPLSGTGEPGWGTLSRSESKKY